MMRQKVCSADVHCSATENRGHVKFLMEIKARRHQFDEEHVLQKKRNPGGQYLKTVAHVMGYCPLSEAHNAQVKRYCERMDDVVEHMQTLTQEEAQIVLG